MLKYSTTNRDGYREYKSNPQVCANCPTREKCTRKKDFIKTVTRHIWKPYVDMAEELRYTERHKKYYKMRKETIERVFADAKEKHGMRYTRYTGLAQVTNWVRLKFAAMNLKKFAIRKWEDAHDLLQIRQILIFWPQYTQNPSFAGRKTGVSRQSECVPCWDALLVCHIGYGFVCTPRFFANSLAALRRSSV